MIDTVLNSLEDVIGASLPVHERFGLCELWPTDQGPRPVKLTGAQGKYILEDVNGSLSYWRITGKIEQRRGVDCDDLIWSIPLRLCYLLDRSSDTCADVPDALLQTILSMRAMERQVQVGVPGSTVYILSVGVESSSPRASTLELGGVKIPMERAFVFVDMTVSIQGSEECLQICDAEPYDPCANCGEGEDCPYSGVITVDGVSAGTFGPFDPCVNNTLNINITYS